MKITYLKTVGFRKFAKIFETEAYGITNITGKNRSGKSNILYAIINIFLGSNLTGDEKVSLINKNCDASYGEIHFLDNKGLKHILIRGKHKIDSKQNFIMLDGRNIKQEELVGFYKDKKLFLSIMNPIYFLNKKPSEQKEFVDKYLSEIKPYEIFSTLTEKEQKELLDIYYKGDKKYDELSQQEKEEYINLYFSNICMYIVYNKLSKEEKKLLGGVPNNMQSYIAEINEEIKMHENEIKVINGKIEYANSIVKAEIPSKKTFELEEKLIGFKDALDKLKNNQDMQMFEQQKQIVIRLEEELNDRQDENNELLKTMQKEKVEYIRLKQSKSPICPTCNQPIKREKLIEIVQEMKKELMALYDKSEKQKENIAKLKINLSVERCRLHSAEAKSNVDPDRVKNYETNVKILEDEKDRIDTYNKEIEVKKRTAQKAQDDINVFVEKKFDKKKLIDNLKETKKVAQKLYISYIEEKMKMAKKYLKDVDIRFYSVLKTTGEIKEDFIITYKNKALSDLSRSETVATALEFANMFNKITKVKLPIFIDDYESCVDYNFKDKYSKGTQLFISKVEKGKPLSISNNDNSKIMTFKTQIKGCKTLNIQKYNILKAA